MVIRKYINGLDGNLFMCWSKRLKLSVVGKRIFFFKVIVLSDIIEMVLIGLGKIIINFE